jgi:esterase/lipase
MSVKILKKTITNDYFSFNAMTFLADEESKNTSSNIFAVFSHGYTASKSDLINWATRLSGAGINVCIFDLPGHHLGSYNEVRSFDEFTEHAQECFLDAFNLLKEQARLSCERLILGGHSLGALLAIKALDAPELAAYSPIGVGVGLGISQHATTHLFESSFYQKTLNIRRQLVHENIDSMDMFTWIKEEKLQLSLTGHRIHLITGKDDIVVEAGGMHELADLLESRGNNVSRNEPNRLPHNNPELAGSHIFSFLKKELNLL